MNFNDEQPMITMSAAAQAPEAVRTLSILVVDDEALFRGVIRQCLELQGHRVSCAACGHEVPEMLKTQKFDVVITDILMPDGDGMEVLMSLRQLQPQARVIAMSGGGDFFRPTDSLGMARKLGAREVLAKPFNREQLIGAVQAVSG